MFRNALKEKLLAGKHCFGCLKGVASPEIVEMLGCMGFDFVLLDCEHGAVMVENVEESIRAAEVSGTVPLVRPPIIRKDTTAPSWTVERGASTRLT